MADLEMITRSDILIGSMYVSRKLTAHISTFSTLAAILRATFYSSNKAIRQRSNNESIPVASSSSKLHQEEPYFIPPCKQSIATRPVGTFEYNPHFECGNSEQKGILLPPACSYWNKSKIR